MLCLYNKLVFDYINGEDIENIDELENDSKFMMEVINVSRDKNIYNLCSDEVKNNYEFVKFVIDSFKNDKSFVDYVATEYLKNHGISDINARELYFIMSQIFCDYDDDRSYYYRLKRHYIYENERMAIDYLIENEQDLILKKRLGMGFVLIINSDIGTSDIMTRFFVYEYLKEIFYERKISLEELLHSMFPNKNKLKLYGVKNFIIDYVKRYDSELSDYLFVHIDLLKDIEKDINYIINRWDNYLDNKIFTKKLIFEQEVCGLIDKYNANLSYFSICSYIDKLHLNIPVKLSLDDFVDVYPINIKELELKEYICLKNIIQLAKDLFGNFMIDTEYEYRNFNVNNGKKCRILNFKSK